MKTALHAVIAALSLVGAAAAHAESEGNGDPFSFHGVGITTAVGPSSGTLAVAALRQAPTPQHAQVRQRTSEATSGGAGPRQL